MITHVNVVEIANVIKQNNMCIDKLVKGENDKIKKDKWAQKINNKTGEIDLKDLDIPMIQDFWLGTYADDSEITINKIQENDQRKQSRNL